MKTEQIAEWAYIAFVVIAIVMGLAVGYMAWNADPNYLSTNAWVTLILLILGIIIGLTSITMKEVTPFLIATIALIVATAADVWQPLRTISELELLYYWAAAITNYIAAFAAPAAVIIAIKAVLAMAKEK